MPLRYAARLRVLTCARHAVLSQSPEGWWDPTTTVAFALEARSTLETAQVKPGLLERLKDKMMGMGQVTPDLMSSDTGERVSSDADNGGLVMKLVAIRRLSLMSVKESKNRDYLDESNDDPLWCNPRAIRASMPRRLEALRSGDASDDLQLERVWATLCCCAFLQTINVCWLATDGELYPDEEETMVDVAYGWVDAHAAKHPALAAALEDGLLIQAAKRTMSTWHRAWKRRVGDLRRADAFTEHHGTALAHRASSELSRAVCTKHSTFAVFLSAPLDGMQRWQMWCMLLTVIVTQLLVNIWMFCACPLNRHRAVRAC